MKERGNVWWVQRKFGTLGVIARSLETKTKAIARQREDLLIHLLDKGWTDLLLAFKSGRFRIDQLVEARDTETSSPAGNVERAWQGVSRHGPTGRRSLRSSQPKASTRRGE